MAKTPPSSKSKISFPEKVLAPVRDYLLREQKELRDRKKRLDTEDPFKVEGRDDDNAAIDTDVAEQVGHERVVAIKSEINRNLVRIRKSLTRIKLGKYGICGNCGKMIDTDRLSINPTAEFCVTCERKVESKRR